MIKLTAHAYIFDSNIYLFRNSLKLKYRVSEFSERKFIYQEKYEIFTMCGTGGFILLANTQLKVAMSTILERIDFLILGILLHKFGARNF